MTILLVHKAVDKFIFQCKNTINLPRIYMFYAFGHQHKIYYITRC